MTGTNGQLLGLSHFGLSTNVPQVSPTTQQVWENLGLFGTPARGTDGSIMIGSTVFGASNLNVGVALFHVDGVNCKAGSLAPTPPLPPLNLPVSMAE